MVMMMKISKCKKGLARIISENGGWVKGNYAVQDKDDKCVWFMTDLEGRPSGNASWPGCKSGRIKHDSLLPNWHQTILSRAEYFHLYPAPDADGWIEWKGGECPVGGDVIEVRYRDYFNEVNHIGESRVYDWVHHGSNTDIIAYRLHKQSEPEFCESVMRSIPDQDKLVWTNPPTIEQLAADYRSAKDYANRKQQEADAAKADADAKLAELVEAGKEHGLLVSPIAENMTSQKLPFRGDDW